MNLASIEICAALQRNRKAGTVHPFINTLHSCSCIRHHLCMSYMKRGVPTHRLVEGAQVHEGIMRLSLLAILEL